MSIVQNPCHYFDRDPGTSFSKDEFAAIDLDESNPGLKKLTPLVVSLEEGTYRMYYTSDIPDGRRVVLSSASQDLLHWEHEAGTRMEPGDGIKSVQSPDVIRCPGGGYRMYFEAVYPDNRTEIWSATSDDGLLWRLDEGVRISSPDRSVSYGSPCCVFLSDGFYRMYLHQSPRPLVERFGQNNILSAVSVDGLKWQLEEGVRIEQSFENESYAVYGANVSRLGDGTYRMYFSGWASKPEMRGRIFSARSSDGLTWSREKETVIDLGGPYGDVICSEPCIAQLPNGRYKLFYEASDEARRWRILSASCVA